MLRLAADRPPSLPPSCPDSGCAPGQHPPGRSPGTGHPSLLSPPFTPRLLRAALPGTAPDPCTAGRTGRDGPERAEERSPRARRLRAPVPRGPFPCARHFRVWGGGAGAPVERVRPSTAGLAPACEPLLVPAEADPSRGSAPRGELGHACSCGRGARGALAQRGGSFKRCVRGARASGRFALGQLLGAVFIQREKSVGV